MDQLATSRYRVESFPNVSRNSGKTSMIAERSIRNETDLIDFAIASFAKCRTTTLMKATSAVEQVYKPVEVHDIRNDHMNTIRNRHKDPILGWGYSMASSQLVSRRIKVTSRICSTNFHPLADLQSGRICETSNIALSIGLYFFYRRTEPRQYCSILLTSVETAYMVTVPISAP